MERLTPGRWPAAAIAALCSFTQIACGGEAPGEASTESEAPAEAPTDPMFGPWRLAHECTRLNGGAPNARPDPSMDHMRFIFREDGVFERHGTRDEALDPIGWSRDGDVRWDRSDGVARILTDAEPTLELRLELRPDRLVLTATTGDVFCLRRESVEETAAAEEAARVREEAVRALAARREEALGQTRVEVLSADRQGPVVHLRVRVTNRGPRALRAFRGEIRTFSEKVPITGVHLLTHETPLGPNESAEVTSIVRLSRITYGFATLVVGETRVSWEPLDLVYADGTRLSVRRRPPLQR